MLSAHLPRALLRLRPMRLRHDLRMPIDNIRSLVSLVQVRDAAPCSPSRRTR